MNKINILIFPAGGENAIDIHDSLKYNLHFNLFGASSKEDYAQEIYKPENYCISNFQITDKNFIENFNQLIDRFKIEYIIPTHDTVALYLMKNANKIKAEVICSPYETSKIAQSKYLMFEHLKNKNYIPKIYNSIEEIENFPVFLKPYIGVGGKGTYCANDKNALEEFLKGKQDYLISEYLPGEELTVDCFTDRNRNLLFIGPRTRERITMGISFTSSRVELTKEIEEIAKDLNETFIFRGAWFFQLRRDIYGKFKLLEFSVRHAGTMALYRELGINFTALSLFDAMNLDVNIIFNNYNIRLNRRLSNSYQLDYEYNHVYIDFDDTLIIDGKVNSDAMKFLYQCSNKGKKIYLITKHSTNIYEDLKKYHIDRSLFDEIFLLEEAETKIDYIHHGDSIFIDNYFKERKEIFDGLHIPVFDVDAIECLLDYSEV